MLFEDIDKKILRIQESTRTSLPFFIPWHNILRLKFKWYYNWHLLRSANILHFLVLALFSAGMFFTVYNSAVPKSNASTSDTKLIDTYSEWGQGSADSNIDIETTQGSVKLKQQIGTTAAWTNETSGPGSSTLAANTLGADRDTSAQASDGQDIYVFGGVAYPTFLKDCYKYDVSENSWTKLADMPGTLGWGDAEYLNGKFYVFAGSEDGNGYDYKTYEYDPTANSWQTKTSPPNYREGLAAEKLSDGKIYLVGGSSSPCLQNEECLNTNMQIDVFDPIANSWSTITSTNKFFTGSGIAYNDDLYIIGGQTMIGPLNKIMKFDWNTSTWSQVATLTRARTASEVAVLDDKIYAFGGIDVSGNSVAGYEIFNPADNTVTLKENSNFTRWGNRINNTVIGNSVYHYGGDGDSSSSSIIKFPSTFSVTSPGVHTSAATQLDAGEHDSVTWTNFVPSGTIPANTSIAFKFRSSIDGSSWGSWTSSAPYAASIDVSSLLGLTDAAKRYLQVETTLANTNATSTPTLDSYTANFEYNDIAQPTCSDGIQNGEETGVDCGGSCTACPVEPTCSDGIQNGNETGVDCGGSCGECTVPPTCTDGIKNQGEEKTDCGGPCAACPVDPPTCTDGIQNGDETGVDSGGSCEEPKTCTSDELKSCMDAADAKYQKCLTDAGNDSSAVLACYNIPCADGNACLTKCGLTGTDVTDKVHVIAPNGGETYKVADKAEIKWDFNRLKHRVVKDSYAIKFSLSTDSGRSYKEIKVLLPKGKNTSWIPDGTSYDYYVVKNKNGQTVNISAWPEVTDGYLSYLWEIPNDASFISDQVRVKLEPFAFCSGGSEDISDNDFKIIANEAVTTLVLTVKPLSPRIKVGMEQDVTVTAKLSDGTDVTSATTFGFRLSKGGTISSQNNNVVTIKAGDETGTFNRVLAITGTFRDKTATTNTGIEVYNDTVPPPDECTGLCSFTDIVDKIFADIKGSSAASSLSLAVAAMLAMAIGLLNIAGNVASAFRGADVFSFFIKGMSKKDARGMVYDAMTGFGIPYATVILTNNKSEQSSFAITDKNGQYSISVSPFDSYTGKVEKLKYDLYKGYNSTKVKKFDLKYSHNYFGGTLQIPKDTYLFDYNLPMIPTETDTIARKVNLLASIGKALVWLNTAIILVGLAFSFYAIAYSPSLYNWIIFTLYIALIIYLLIKYLFLGGHNYGAVVDAKGKPVELALVRAVRVKTGKLAKTIATDKAGKFGIALPVGVYHIFVNKAGMMQTNEVDAIITSAMKPAKVEVKLDVYTNNTIKPDSQTEVLSEAQKNTAKSMKIEPETSVNSADEIIEKFGS